MGRSAETSVRFLVLLAILATATACVSRQTVAPQPLGRPSPAHENLVATFAECVSVLGPVRELPVVEAAGAQTVIGPFSAEHGRLAFPHRDRPPMLMELA